MFLTVWKFSTVVLTALLLGTTLAHALEMPQKILLVRAGYAGEVS